MKTKLALFCLAAAVSQAGAADYYITGATAFRTAAVKAICSKFSATGFVAGYNDGTSLTGANKSVFRGTFGTLSGVTTIYCTWNGSVEGVRALAVPTETVQFLSTAPTASADPAAASGGSDVGNATIGVQAQLAFSDVFKSSTPYRTATLYPSDSLSSVGVVAFSWVAHKGSDTGLSNITTQSARAIFTQGYQPLSLFTGLDTDNSKYVFLTGRNDGSGTRTTFLAESGQPITLPIRQYKSTLSGDSTTVNSLRVWPTSDGTNASLIWTNGIDIPGNGGYASGSGLTTVMKAASAAGGVPVFDADGSPAFDAAPISILGYQSTKDALDSQNGGGRLLSYNGFKVTYSGSDISPETRKAIMYGQYTMWGYEHLYSRINLSSDSGLNTVYQAIKSGCTVANLGNSGITTGEMQVSRTTDGALVAP